jgi:hypothetical protein
MNRIRGTLPFSNSVPEKVLMALVNHLYQYTDSVEEKAKIGVKS